ncbi:SRPBCC family protein [Sphaerisporangium aureirubrum]|uniref:SRPBCC family protein n=1 Tax=Sphaerisporangium aureirubrum TaxID=1544736 RepID=A0ABW1NC76_9ACTN
MRFEHDFTVPVPVEQAWAVLLDVERVAPCLPGATLDTVDGDGFTGRLKVKVGPITVTYKGQASFSSVDKDGHKIVISASGKEARGTGTAKADVEAELSGEGGWTRVAVRTSFNVTGRPAQFGRGVMAEVGAKLIDRFAANLAALLRESQEPPSEKALAEGAAPPSAEPAATPFNESTESPSPPEATPLAPVAGLQEQPVPEPHVRHLSAVPDRYDAAEPDEVTSRDAHPAGTARTSRTPDEEALDLLEIAGMPLLKRLAPVVGGLAAIVLVTWLLRRLLSRR